MKCINGLEEELRVVNELLLQQEKVLLAFRDCLDPRSFREPNLSCAMKFKFHRDSIERVLVIVHDQLLYCRELRERAKTLIEQNVRFAQVMQAESTRKRWEHRLGRIFQNVKLQVRQNALAVKPRTGKTRWERRNKYQDEKDEADQDVFPTTEVKQQTRRATVQTVIEDARQPSTAFAVYFQRRHTEEAQAFRTATLQMFWSFFPNLHGLEGRVGNPDDPGDGLVYDAEQVEEATKILKELYHHWHQMQPVLPCPPSQKLPDMGKICLILTGMRQQAIFEDFLDSAFNDQHLPLQLDHLKGLLKERHSDYADMFASEQYRAVPRPWQEGEHIVINPEEPLPLVFEQAYRAGSYGIVDRVHNAFSGELYARKQQIVNSEDRATIAAGKHLRTEALRLRGLQHRHIVQLVKTYQRGSSFGSLLRPAATTDLERLLTRFKNDKLSPIRGCTDSQWLRPIILTAFGCLSRSLDYIHGCGMRHKDIKPANILFESDKDNGDKARFLLADFGLAYKFDDTRESQTEHTEAYTRRYAAPETLADNYHGKSADVFSLGCVFLELLASLYRESLPLNREAFTERHDSLVAWAARIKRQNHGNDLADLCRTVILMISKDPEDRPTMGYVSRRLAKAGRQFFCETCSEDFPNREPLPASAPRSKTFILPSTEMNLDPDLFNMISKELSLHRRTSSASIRSATFLVHWDLHHYVQEELGHDLYSEDDLGSGECANLLSNVLTISGTVQKAYAASLKDYVRWKWPNSKIDIFECLKERVRGIRSGKSPSRIRICWSMTYYANAWSMFSLEYHRWSTKILRPTNHRDEVIVIEAHSSWPLETHISSLLCSIVTNRFRSRNGSQSKYSNVSIERN